MTEGDYGRCDGCCANCEAAIQGSSAKSIISTWEGEGTRPTPISIYQALSIIFEKSPLSPAVDQTGSKTTNGNDKFSPIKRSGESNYYGLCLKCSETLCTLYNSFQEFTSNCKLSSRIGKILKQLESEKRRETEEVEREEADPVVKLEPPDDYIDESNVFIDNDNYDNYDVKHVPDSPLPNNEDNDDNQAASSSSSDDSEVENIMPSSRQNMPKSSSSSTTKVLLCPKCGKEFLYETTLICHRRIIHQEDIASIPPPRPMPTSTRLNSRTGEETSTCPICRQIVLRRDIRTHLSTHTRSNLRPWMCLLCLREFSNQTELYRHSETHKSHIRCRNCSKPIPRLEMLAHIRQCFPNPLSQTLNRVHNTRKPPVPSAPSSSAAGSRWSCQLCRISFTRKDLMISHMETHKQTKRHVCRICDRRFDRSDLLRLHVKRFHRGNEGPSFTKSTTLNSPMMMNLGDDDNDMDVPATDPLDQFGQTVQHSSSSQGSKIDNAYRFLCKGCDIGFSRYRDVEKHLMETHTDKDNSICRICGRKVQDNFCLSLHLKFHIETKPFSCFLCENKTYQDKTNFYQHLKETHNLEDTVIIDNYPSVFKYNKEYMRKQRIRNRILAGEKQLMKLPKKGDFPCDLCDFKFSYENALLKHKRQVHDKVKEFICSYCGKAFARKSYSLVHEKLHTSTETPYKCHLCGKGFRLPGNLRSHLKSTIHNSERNFVCETCGKGFNRKDNLRLHIRAVHLKIQIRKPRGDSNYIGGIGRKRRYGADLPSPEETSEGNSSVQNMPSTSTTTFPSDPKDNRDNVIRSGQGLSSTVPVISHTQAVQQQQQQINISQGPFSQAEFSTIQSSQLGFTYRDMPSY